GGDLLVQRLVGGVGEQVPQAAGAVGDVGRRVVEQGEEGVVGGDQAEAHSSGSGGEVGDTFDGGHGAGRTGAGGRREGRARRPRPATGVVPAGDGHARGEPVRRIGLARRRDPWHGADAL